MSKVAGISFRYRYVDYGTTFSAAKGIRITLSEPSNVYENELVVDVEGVCWGYNTDLAVLDHHSSRDDGAQFPSAAAVLHNAARIANRPGRSMDATEQTSKRRST